MLSGLHCRDLGQRSVAGSQLSQGWLCGRRDVHVEERGRRACKEHVGARGCCRGRRAGSRCASDGLLGDERADTRRRCRTTLFLLLESDGGGFVLLGRKHALDLVKVCGEGVVDGEDAAPGVARELAEDACGVACGRSVGLGRCGSTRSGRG